MCHVSRVMCDMLSFTYHLLHVTGPMLHLTFFFYYYYYYFFLRQGQIGGASQWWVCYYQGLSRLVYMSGPNLDICVFQVP